LFETSSGESIPFSAEMISVELTDDGIGAFDPEFLKHAASAVFHYFKHDLGRITSPWANSPARSKKSCAFRVGIRAGR